MADRTRVAALLDRDGTLIEDRHYLRDPEQVVLLPGVGRALRRLEAAGYALIVCTNQSGIARGTISLAQYRAVRRRVDELLAAEDVVLRDTLACPHHPDEGLPCDCRKPGTGLFERAAALHGLDLSHSLFVGDKWRDVVPAATWGARSALIAGMVTPPEEVERARAAGIVVTDSLASAVDSLLS